MADYGVTYGFTIKNKPKLVFQRRFYKMTKTDDTGAQYWLCINQGCKGSLRLDPDGKPTVLKDHNETETLSDMEYELEMAKDRLKTLTMNNPDWSAAQLVQSLIESVNPLFRAALPLKSSMITNVRRWRQPKIVKTSNTQDDIIKPSDEVDDNDGKSDKQALEHFECPKKLKGTPKQKRKVSKPIESKTTENDCNNGRDENAPVWTVTVRNDYLVAGGSLKSKVNGLTKVHQPRTKLIAFNQKRKRNSSDTENDILHILKPNNQIYKKRSKICYNNMSKMEESEM